MISLVRPTLYGRVRYPLCGRCRCRPMQPMGGRQFSPQGMRCSGTGGLYSGGAGILCGPGIAGDNFRLLYRKSGGLGASIGPRIRTRASINVRMHACSKIIKHASSCFHFLARVNFRHPGPYDAAIELARQSLQSLCGGARVLVQLDNDSQQE